MGKTTRPRIQVYWFVTVIDDYFGKVRNFWIADRCKIRDLRFCNKISRIIIIQYHHK